jgi:hypothetical protein
MEEKGKYVKNYGNQNLGMTVIVTNQARAYHALGYNNITLPSTSACNLQTTQLVSCIISSNAQMFLRPQLTSQGIMV